MCLYPVVSVEGSQVLYVWVYLGADLGFRVDMLCFPHSPIKIIAHVWSVSEKDQR